MNPNLEEMMRSTSMPDEIPVSTIIERYLLEYSETFKELTDLRLKGWESREGDRFFENRRAQYENITPEQAQSFFNMTCQIGEEMDKKTSVITRAGPDAVTHPSILDIGMAPGGFSETVLRKHRNATIRGITLPKETGGLEMMLPQWEIDPRIRIEFLDVAMLADEMGRPTTSIPITHPDIAKLSSKRPFNGETFDLVFCGASGATNQRAHFRADYRDPLERGRLVTSQLVVALQRLRDHGSLVLLMHNAEAIDTAEVIRTFTRFSKVRLFKPRKKHAIRSSFYMVATEVDVQSEYAQSALVGWKMQWEKTTFQSDDALAASSRKSEGQVREMLAEFGPQLIRLATPIWKTQANALRSAPFLRG